MNNVLSKTLIIKDNIKIQPYDCVKEDNMRILIKAIINEGSEKRAVVIGINPSLALMEKVILHLQKSADICTNTILAKLQ